MRRVVRNYRRMWSALKGSALFAYVDNTSCDRFADKQEAFVRAAETFRRAASETLKASPLGLKNIVGRVERTNPMVLKTLLFIGYDPGAKSFGLVARVIETRSRHPDISIKTYLTELSKLCGTPYDTLNRAVEKSFNIYDEYIMERVSYLTDTQPLNAKDVINDLATYVRVKLFTELLGHA